MPSYKYHYTFDPSVDLNDVRSSMLLALWACEGLHGATQMQLEVKHDLKAASRTLVVDVSTPTGGDFNRILYAFLRREFTVQQMTMTAPAVQSHSSLN